MKKRILSCLMALALCLTLLPTAALAEETEGTAQTPPAVEEAADPANGKAKQENQPAETKQENQPVEQEEQQEDSAAKQAVADVQAMIDALPDAEALDGMDDEDAMAVYEAFQTACDAYYETLNEEQQEQLKNTEKLAALSDWFSQSETLAAGTHQDHCICGKSGCTETSHNEITFGKWLASSTLSGKRELRVGEIGSSSSEIYGDPLTAESGKYVLDGGNYYLKTGVEGFDSDVTIEHPIQITGNVTICLNGQTIESTAEDQPVFEIVTGGTLILTDCKNNKGKVTHASGGTGCGVEVNGGEFNLYGGSITGNTAANGGVYVGSYGQAGTFKMYGGKITNNTATQNGGGVYVYEGTFDMDDGEISGNKTNGFGGGVYVSRGNCKFTMSGGEIKDNTARSGGGVSVFDDGVFTMRGGSITKNKTTGTGGGVSMNSGGNFTVSGKAVIKDNKMGTANNNVYLFGNKFITVSGHLDDGASIGVTTDKTPAAGGTIPIATATTGTSLDDKDAAKFQSDVDGYAVSVNGNKNGLLLVKAHTHYLCGGDECVCNSVRSCGLVTFTAWNETNSLPNTAGKYYLTNDVKLSSTWEPKTGTVLCLNGYSIKVEGNKIAAITVNDDMTFTLCDCKGEGKTAYGQITHFAEQYRGCGVKVNGGVFNLYGGSIANNKSDYDGKGGGVYVVNDGAFNLFGGSITGNTAMDKDGKGGGVYVGGGVVTMLGGEITGNLAANGTANQGGGVYMESGTFTMYDGEITNNTATDGGGVYVCGGRFDMSGGSITNNRATGTSGIYGGGGVYVDGGSSFHMTGGAITGNNTANEGGGVYVGGNFNMSGGSITSNTAANEGGGVYVRHSNAEFNMSGNAKISNNTANQGGGVFVYVTGNFNMSGGEVSSNTATQIGGGVYVYVAGNFNMSGGKISGNTAAQSGGGVYVHSDEYGGGTFTVSGSASITGNTVGEKPDNVYLSDSANNPIAIGASGLSGRIGVTLKEWPAEGTMVVIATGTSPLTGTDAAKFTSDMDGYRISANSDGKLVLATVNTPITPPVTTAHEHFLCTTGGACDHVGGHTCAATGFDKWTSENALPGTAGSYYLDADVTLDEPWTPANGTVLCLNGHSIAANGNFDTIKVNGGTFTLTDCQSSQGSVTHANGAYGRGVEVENGTFNLYGGSITGNNGGYTDAEAPLGGGVKMKGDSKFNMYGGKISGNTGGRSCIGGGVFVAYSSSTFNLYGGEISGNWASFGGGVDVYGTFNMSGGEITDNEATYGGGVEVRGSTAAFNMSGGSITKNTASGNGASEGGGVLVLGGTFTVSGSANITGNTANNVYLYDGKTITIGGGGLSGTIGVTTKTKPAENKPVTVIADTKGISVLTKHVVSDDNAYKTAVRGSTIVLQVRETTGGETPQPVPVTGITLPATATLKVGETTTLTATVEPSNATNKNVTWTSSNENVATVTANGTVTAKATGTTTITATAADGSGKSATCTVTVNAATPSQPGGSTGGSSSGSSSGGGSSSDRDSSDSNPIIKTETKNNADGSTTKTETRRDGSVTATTTAKNGSTSKTETKKDGSSVTENKAADGSTGTIKTDKNGQTEAKTALSNKAVEDAKKNGEAVKAPVEVEASRNSSTAPTVSIKLPKGAGETKVEIPVSNVKPGTVAVLVHPDGTEEIVKNSVPTEDGIQLTVDGSATVKIVDNSKDFIDTRNHWAREEIDFVSARELVNGISATRYAPDATATRAQLWTILARQNDTDLSGGANWYEKAQLWSKDKGISDGTNPNGTINRAQMVTMLWRTMGQPAAASGASFADVPADSYYVQAVSWAVENGITTGVGNGRFDPAGACTRAQIAAFLTRLYAEN